MQKKGEKKHVKEHKDTVPQDQRTFPCYFTCPCLNVERKKAGKKKLIPGSCLSYLVCLFTSLSLSLSLSLTHLNWRQ